MYSSRRIFKVTGRQRLRSRRNSRVFERETNNLVRVGELVFSAGLGLYSAVASFHPAQVVFFVLAFDKNASAKYQMGVCSRCRLAVCSAASIPQHPLRQQSTKPHASSEPAVPRTVSPPSPASAAAPPGTRGTLPEKRPPACFPVRIARNERNTARTERGIVRMRRPRERRHRWHAVSKRAKKMSTRCHVCQTPPPAFLLFADQNRRRQAPALHVEKTALCSVFSSRRAEKTEVPRPSESNAPGKSAEKTPVSRGTRATPPPKKRAPSHLSPAEKAPVRYLEVRYCF